MYASNINITDIFNTPCFSGVKRSWREDGHLLPSNTEVKFGGAIPPFPHTPSFHVNGKHSLYVQSTLRLQLRRHRSITNANRIKAFDSEKY